jgi:PAS domain S-box-containing protein
MRIYSQHARDIRSDPRRWLAAMVVTFLAATRSLRFSRATLARLVTQVHPAVWTALMGVATILLSAVVVITLLPDPGGPATIAVTLMGIAVATSFAGILGGAIALLSSALLLNTIYDQGERGVSAVDMAITIVMGAALLVLIERNRRELARARTRTITAKAATGALASVEQAIAAWSPGDPEGTTRALHQLLMTMVTLNRAHAGSLYLLEENGCTLRRTATIGTLDGGQIAMSVMPIGEGFTGRVAEERRPLSIRDIPNHGRFAREHFYQTGIRSILGVPLIAPGDTLLGVATIALYVPHRFGKTEIARLEALAVRTVAFLELARGADRQRELLNQVRGSHRRLQDVIMAMPEAVVVAAPDGTVLSFNTAAVRLLGGQTVGEPLLTTQGAPALLDRVSEGSERELPLAKTLRTGDVVTGIEVQLAHRDGSLRPVLASAAPLWEPDGSLAAAVGVFQDIRPLKEAHRIRDEFVSVVSHELRSPLTPIRGFAQLVARDLEREGGHAIHVARLRSLETHIDRMTRLIDDLLDVSRLRAGHLRTVPARVDLRAICVDVVLARQATNTAHTLVIDAGEEPVWGTWDADRLHQVVDNLVSNATKYTPGGSITISISYDETKDEALLEIVDSGPGISSADRERLFTPFYRTLDATNSRLPGLGLGLYICRELVQAHGGTIDCDEGSGGGTRFTIRLPRERAIPPLPDSTLTELATA